MRPFLFAALGLSSAFHALAADKPAVDENFAVTPEYHALRRLDANYLSPFRKPAERAQQAQALPKATGPNVSGALEKFNALGLTGIIPSSTLRLGTIILGGNIYREGQEIVLFNGRAHSRTPLLPDHRVVLKSITPQALELSISLVSDSQAPAVKVPVALLEFRQR